MVWTEEVASEGSQTTHIAAPCQHWWKLLDKVIASSVYSENTCQFTALSPVKPPFKNEGKIRHLQTNHIRQEFTLERSPPKEILKDYFRQKENYSWLEV